MTKFSVGFIEFGPHGIAPGDPGGFGGGSGSGGDTELPGTAFSTPDPFSGSISAIDLRVVAKTLWQTNPDTPIAAWQIPVGNDWVVLLGTNGAAFGSPFDGTLWGGITTTTGGGSTDSSTDPVSVSDNVIHCIRLTWSPSTIEFFEKATTIGNYKTDVQSNSGWTSLGTVASVSGSLINVNSTDVFAVGFGSPPDWGEQIYFCQVATSIDGSPLFVCDVADWSGGATWVSADTGETWTIVA